MKIEFVNVLPQAVLFFFFPLFAIISFQHEQLKIDEKFHHLPALKNIEEFGIIEGVVNESYSSANTPLSYLIAYLPAYLLSIEIDIYYARLINVITSFFFLSLLYYYIKSISGNALLIVPLIFFYPYLLKTSFVYYQAIYGLLFFILYLIFFEREDYKGWVVSGLFLSLAVLCQQFYLALIPARPIYSFFKLNHNKITNSSPLTLSSFIENGKLSIVNQFSRNPISSTNRKLLTGNCQLNYLKLILHLLSLTLPFVLFFTWGGFTHPNYQRHTIAFSPTNVTSILAIIGFIFIPYILLNIKEIFRSRRLYLFAFIALLLSFFFTPIWANRAGPGNISGLTFHGLEIISAYSTVLKYFFQVIIIVFGLEVIFTAVCREKKCLIIILFLFLIGYTFNILLSERHLLPLMFVLLILILNDIPKKMLFSWLPYQFLLGSVYFYYLISYNNY